MRVRRAKLGRCAKFFNDFPRAPPREAILQARTVHPPTKEG
jgi:hypothetical protein